MDVRQDLGVGGRITELEGFASIVDRIVELMDLAAVGLDDNPEAAEVVERLQSRGKDQEAREFVSLLAEIAPHDPTP